MNDAPPPRVLLVDDRPENLLALEAVLGDLGLDLARARSGDEALRRLLDADFAAVLLDVQMPGVDGFEVARLIRARPRSRPTPIIFLTAGESDDFPVAEAYRLGAVDYLVRPLVPDIVRAKVAVFVELYRLRTAERVLAEDALRASEARHRAVVETALDCVIGMDHAGRVTEFNPAAEAAFGYARAEALGRELSELAIPPEHRDAHRRGLARYLATGEEHVLRRRLELTAVRKGGDRFPCELSITRNPGEPPSFTGFLRDITDRRRAEDRQRFLADLAAATQPRADPDEVAAVTARRLAEHLGADRCAYAEVEDEAVYVITGDHTRGVPSIVGRWPVAAFGAEHHRMMRAGEAYVVHDADADPRVGPGDLPAFRATCIRAVVCVPLNKGGRFTAAMAVHQATPRRWAPEEVDLVRTVVGRCWEALERARSVRRLRESEERFRTAVAATSDIVWTNDAAGKMAGEQPGWGAFTGQTYAEYQGYGWSAAVHPDDARGTIAAWERAVAGRRRFEFEHRVRRRDGEYRLCAIRAVPVSAGDGSVREWVGVHTDITEQRALELALREAGRRKDEFLATLAHELRNPLAPIRNGLAVLRLTLEPGAAARTVEMMDRQLGQLVHLVDDLLDVSRVTSGKVVLRPERHDLRETVGAAVETSRPAVEAHGHALAVRLPDAPVWVDGDRTRLVQVLTNLLTNACKYTPSGGRIEVAAEPAGGVVVVRVADTGVGIPADMLPKVFEVFTQVNQTLDRAQGGLGLGLALVKKLVEMHGGEVSAESPGPNRGSTFEVRLPLAGAPVAQTATNGE